MEIVLRNVDHLNEVFLFFQFTDLEKARGFVSSPEVPVAQQQSGVLDKPDIYILS